MNFISSFTSKKKRKDQQAYWFENSVREGVFEQLQKDKNWQKQYEKLSIEVADGSLNPFEASEKLVRALKGKV